jgi:hypothetical protein
MVRGKNHTTAMIKSHVTTTIMRNAGHPFNENLWLFTHDRLELPTVPNVHHVPILHNVILAFQAQRPFGAGIRLRSCL